MLRLLRSTVFGGAEGGTCHCFFLIPACSTTWGVLRTDVPEKHAAQVTSSLSTPQRIPSIGEQSQQFPQPFAAFYLLTLRIGAWAHPCEHS